MTTRFSVVVEGITDEAAIKRVFHLAGCEVSNLHTRLLKKDIIKQLPAYNKAAETSPWLVLVDLDDAAACAPQLLKQWLPTKSLRMIFRVAVVELEAWLIADSQRLSRFLDIPEREIPDNPEQIANPKQALVQLARLSRKREIRSNLVPRQNSGRKVGPGYASQIAEFILDARNGWRPDVAANKADSLRRCINAIYNLDKLLG